MRSRPILFCLAGLLALAAIALISFSSAPAEVTDNPVILAYAEQMGLDPALWPPELAELLERDPETEEFVLGYPLRPVNTPDPDLSGLEPDAGVPLLLQWDPRWGYAEYGGSMMGLSGCGPTCLSMVCIWLLQDPAYDPLWAARFSEARGCRVPEAGTSWTLFSVEAETLGLDVTELPLDKNRILRELRAGHPIVCAMGPGDFTTTGHFIVLTGCDEEGLLRVNDPNSPSRSARLWDFEEIKTQFRNLWAFEKAAVT